MRYIFDAYVLEYVLDAYYNVRYTHSDKAKLLCRIFLQKFSHFTHFFVDALFILKKLMNSVYK